ncbi:MAG: DUF4388 domain-containing protein [Bdellovibrionales bacterium]|nr:DUF4388 domain-containing protein [Bdellovibrionales bacterium]
MSNDPSPSFSILKPPLPVHFSSIGSLRDLPSYALLVWIANQKFTGRLVLERDKRVKHLFFSQGHLMCIRSNLIMEGIDMVLKRGFLDPRHVVEIQQDVVSQTMENDWEDRMVHHILSKNYLSKDKLCAAIDIQLQEQLLNALGWMEGKYFLREYDEIPSRFDFHPIDIDLMKFLQRIETFLKDGRVECPHPNVALDPIDQGNINAYGGASVLLRYTEMQKSGRLVLKRGKKQKNILFREGKLFSISTSDPKETLENILEKWKFIPKEIIQSISSQARISGTKLRHALHHQKILTESEIKLAFRLLHLERVLECFSWRSGTYKWILLENENPILHRSEAKPTNLPQNTYSFSDVALLISNQTHRKHLVFWEILTQGLEPEDDIYRAFKSDNLRLFKINLVREDDHVFDLFKKDWKTALSQKQIRLNLKQIRKLSPRQWLDWLDLLNQHFDHIFWFSRVKSLGLDMGKSFVSFLIIHSPLLEDNSFEHFIREHKIPKLDGFFVLDSK